MGLITKIRMWWAMRPIKAAEELAHEDYLSNAVGSGATLSRLMAAQDPDELESIADAALNPCVAELLRKGAKRLRRALKSSLADTSGPETVHVQSSR